METRLREGKTGLVIMRGLWSGWDMKKLKIIAFGAMTM